MRYNLGITKQQHIKQKGDKSHGKKHHRFN
nr:MAG TPA: hypothetical protein [Caudoviricetes sp.]